MNEHVKVATIQKIALAKGLIFCYHDVLKCYVMCDKITKDVLMEYADITISLFTNVNTWREECNKLKASAYR